MSDIAETPNTSPVKPPRKRGCLFLLGRGLKWLGMLLIVLVVAGVVYQAVATEMDKRNFSPRGQLYNVNGHQMHLYCVGEGSPTVILEAGGYAESLWWYRVQNQLAEHTQVCSYDRAGMGWSEAGPAPRDAGSIVEELHVLLDEAQIEPPYILAGHSFGGILNRFYATRYPDEVLGITLVDSAIVTEKFTNLSEYEEHKRSGDILNSLIWVMSRLGIWRLTVSGDFSGWGYPSEIVPELVAFRSTNQAFDTYYAETLGLPPELWLKPGDAEDLGDLPLMILWATEHRPMSASDTELIASYQQAITEFSSNSVTRYIEGSDHGTIIGSEDYAQQVTEAILDVIEAVETGEPLT
jgi:pimeloyl-ACP methyl ester carboxylesterase